MNLEQLILGVLLRQARTEAGLRQVDVARKLGRPPSLVSEYERGTHPLGLPELRHLCEIIGIPLLDFMERVEAAFNAKDLPPKEKCAAGSPGRKAVNVDAYGRPAGGKDRLSTGPSASCGNAQQAGREGSGCDR